MMSKAWSCLAIAGCLMLVQPGAQARTDVGLTQGGHVHGTLSVPHQHQQAGSQRKLLDVVPGIKMLSKEYVTDLNALIDSISKTTLQRVPGPPRGQQYNTLANSPGNLWRLDRLAPSKDPQREDMVHLAIQINTIRRDERPLVFNSNAKFASVLLHPSVLEPARYLEATAVELRKALRESSEKGQVMMVWPSKYGGPLSFRA